MQANQKGINLRISPKSFTDMSYIFLPTRIFVIDSARMGTGSDRYISDDAAPNPAHKTHALPCKPPQFCL